MSEILSAEQKPDICADCAGFDMEWMRRCDKHKTQFCRGCSCPACEDEAWDDYEDIDGMDLEDQFDELMDRP